MKVWTKVAIRWDEESQAFVTDEAESSWFDYDGPVALCKKDNDAPKADPAIGQAAKDNIALGRQWLSFAKDQFAEANQRQEGIDAITKEIGQQQLADSKLASERGSEQFERYKALFQPVEDRLIRDANEYDSPERREKAVAEAKADVLSAADDAKARAGRQAAAMGIDPRSGRFAGIDRAADTEIALASAGAQNKARTQVEATGMALREGVANMGRGATSTSAQQTALGLQAGNNAVGNTMAGQQSFLNNGSIMTNGFQGGISANSSGAGILNNLHQNELSGWNAQQQASAAQTAGIASAFGTGIGAFAALSSKDYKEDKEPVDGALEALDSMPVEQWKYKAGIGDGGSHIGPYAEDFKAATGKGDGKSIPMQDMVGVTMKAVQELNKKVDKIAQRQGA